MIGLWWCAHAIAWDRGGWAWSDEQLPVVVVWEGAPEGLTEPEVAEALEAVRLRWTEGTCANFDVEFVQAAVDGLDRDDGRNSVVFDDPTEQLDPGQQAVTYIQNSGDRFERNGVTYLQAGEIDIVFDEDTRFATDAAIAEGDCTDTWSFQAVMTHELGHLLGLGHSCDDGEACSDSDVDATMYWWQEACDSSASTLASDDILGLWNLYGSPLDFDCVADPSDPLGVRCAATGELTSSTWDFGDGATASGTEASHSYAGAGPYTVTFCVERPDCAAQCFELGVYAVGAGTVTGGRAGDTAVPSAEGGCATARTPVTFALAAAGLAVAGWRRPRR